VEQVESLQIMDLVMIGELSIEIHCPPVSVLIIEIQ
jgi:hypothetical protein